MLECLYRRYMAGVKPKTYNKMCLKGYGQSTTHRWFLSVFHWMTGTG